jgi:hypothetical protein
MFENLKNKLLKEVCNVDVDRPTGRCGVCGHKTYMVEGSMSEDVCVYCKIMRILLPLRLPAEVIMRLFGWVNEKINSKNKLKKRL